VSSDVFYQIFVKKVISSCCTIGISYIKKEVGTFYNLSTYKTTARHIPQDSSLYILAFHFSVPQRSPAAYQLSVVLK
jgi:hypothetical protein